jgi:hypothetical protein
LKEKTQEKLTAAYFAVSAANLIFISFTSNLWRALDRADPFQGTLIPHKLVDPLWDATSDPALAFIIRSAIVIAVGSIIPGTLVILVGLLMTGLVLAVGLGAVVEVGVFLVWLAKLSPTGAALVLGGVGTPLWWLLFRKYREQTLRVIDYIIAILMWVRHPQLRHNLLRIAQRGKTIMDEKESELRDQAVRIAEVLGLSLNHVPTQLADYDGFFQEARKRVQMRSLERTRERGLALLKQATAFHTELLALKRTQAQLGRLDKENVVKDLELDEQEYALRAKIEQHKKTIDEINNPPPPPSTDDVDAGDIH